MSSPTLQPISSPTHNQRDLKQLHSLSTLAYTNTPSPQLSTPLNLSRFQSINITDKVKKRLSTSNRTKSKRNQSMGSVNVKDFGNPQFGIMSYLDSCELGGNSEQNIKETKEKNAWAKLGSQQKHSSNNPTQQKLNHILPLINDPKPKKPTLSTKRANYMQLWLDQALDPQQLNPKDLKLIQTQLPNSARESYHPSNSTTSTHLSTVKQYQIDRQYLRSQNVPQEVIERLYNTLYIYSHGIQNVFKEMLALVKKGSGDEQYEQKDDSKLLNVFWKSFIKLLEGCTSFQTTFQKVEDQYVTKINQLKQAFAKRQLQVQKEKQHTDDTICRLQKQLLQIQHTYTKLQTDNKITQATLQLTDFTFNEQVQLRLRFQQKINHIYSSYEQLKSKYNSLLDQMNQTAEKQSSTKGESLQLREKIRHLEGDLEELKHQLKHERQKVRQRDIEITLKKQQLHDLQTTVQFKAEQQAEEQDVMTAEKNKASLLTSKCEQQKNKLALLQHNNQNHKSKLQEQTKTMEMLRQLNEQLHVKCNDTAGKLVEYEACRVFQTAEICKLQNDLKTAKERLSLVEDIRQSLQTNLQKTTEQLQQSRYEVVTRTQAMQKITSTIQDLKAIKNKYERLFKIIDQQKRLIQLEKNKLQQRFQLEKEQIVGLKMLQQNREKHIKELQGKHDKERELLKRKITGYNEIVTKKESLILHYQKVEEERNETLLDWKYRVEQGEKEIEEGKVVMEKVQKEKAFISKRLQQAGQQVQRLNAEIRQQANQLQANLTAFDISQQELQSVSNLLSLLKQQQNSSIINLTSLYTYYREVITRKGQHVHPMLYEDLVQQYNRVQNEVVPRMMREIEVAKLNEEKLRMEIHSVKEIVESKELEIERLEKKLHNSEQAIASQQVQIHSLTSKIATNQTAIFTHQKELNSNKHTILKLQSTIQNLQNLLQVKSNKLMNNQSIQQRIQQQKQILKLNNTIAILSNKVTELQAGLLQRKRNNEDVAKIERLEKELKQLNDQLRVYKNVVKVEKEVQTEPEGQVVIEIKPNNPRKSKFTTEIQQRQDNSTQVSLPPYDNIPLYIEQKITQIRKEQLIEIEQRQQKQQRNESKLSYVMKSKEQMKSEQLRKERSLVKIEAQKEPITRREELRRALRVTYMRR